MGSTKVIRLIVDVHVTDARALIRYARKQYEKCWASDLVEEQGRSLGAHVYEALIASNDNPSPMDYGIEILDHKTEERDAW